MSQKTLVTYGSKYGATAEIAEKIAETVRESGADVDVMPVNRVKGLADYHAVILGSAVYMGFWRKDLARFVDKNATQLAQKMVWFFASGPTGEGDAEEMMQGRIYPPKLKPAIDTIMPVDIKAFHGASFIEKLSGFEKWVMKKVEADMGDFRDWSAIEAWANEISKKL